MNPKKISFVATIIQVQRMNAAYIEFPFSVEELFGTRGQVKVKALFDGKAEYRGSLANMGRNCHTLGLTQEIRNKLQKTFGDTIEVDLVHDLEIREVTIPDDIQSVLSENQEALAFFEKLSYTHRKEYINWICSAKKDETRVNRVVSFIDKLQQKKKPDQK
ncbi:MAG: YdeI/OmpD-associated family protein [Bacteroidota bacterium]|nr:hypothetical protein [Odoribacter sp.]MDP3644238.1 YdeI/OmpD-associated family protein [Bacteroidota bacterium]